MSVLNKVCQRSEEVHDVKLSTYRDERSRKVEQGHNCNDTHDDSLSLQILVQLLSSIRDLTLQMLQYELLSITGNVH